jgi:hypothetical protein
MNPAICTLFEGDHHYGVGALVNSLYSHGFRGTIYAGFRGPLPSWAKGAQPRNGYSELKVVDGLTILFIPLTTRIHFTNYKPQFMGQVVKQFAAESPGIFYFDPDVVVGFPWQFFEEWASDSVALCEDVNSPMLDNHPKRKAWRRFFDGKEIPFRNSCLIYVNGGFIGLPKSLFSFIHLWESIIEKIGQRGIDLGFMSVPADYRFWTIDQDALNIATMATDCPMSLMGKEGMGFIPATGPMTHSIGPNKPWRTRNLTRFLSGKPLTRAEREYWKYVESPIKLFSPGHVRRQMLLLSLAALGGRFYGK